MATLTLNYEIFLPDPAAVAAANAQYPNGFFAGPRGASTNYSAPILGVDSNIPAALSPMVSLAGPWQSSLYVSPSLIDGSINGYSLQALLPPSQFTQVINSSSFTVTFPVGYFYPASYYGSASPQVTFTFQWVGIFLCRMTGATPQVAQKQMGVRRFIEGFELATTGDSVTSSGDRTHVARCASRSSDGYGFALRKTGSLSAATHLQNPSGADPFPTATSERFYIRILTYPVGGEDQLWFAGGRISAGTGANLTVDATGHLKMYNLGLAGGLGTFIAQSGVLALNTWYRIDILVSFANSTVSGTPNGQSVAMWVNGAQQFSTRNIPGSNGLLTVQSHRTSAIGNQGASFGLECDIDDWVGADPLTSIAGPTLANVGGFNSWVFDYQTTGIAHGFDLTTGSHVQALHPTKTGGSMSGWTGDWRECLNNPSTNLDSSSAMSSIIASATIDLITDYTDSSLGCPAVGCAVFTPIGSSPNLSQLGLVSPQFGNALTSLAVASGTFKQAMKAQGTLFSGNILTPVGTTAGTNPGGLPIIPLQPLQSIRVQLIKDPTTTNVTVATLLAAAEFIGVFGPEDNSVQTTALSPIGLHNAPYPTSGAQNSTARPATGVTIASGIYNGNAIGQDILAKLSPQWWFVRPLSGATDGVFWFSTMIGAHGWLNELVRANRMVQATIDTVTNNAPVLRVDGPSPNADANAVSYQWIAVSDPGMRFMLNGCFAHISTDVGPDVNPLVDSSFTPEAAFLFLESVVSSATGSYFKGIGHTANTASPLDATQTTNVASLAAGSISSYSAIHGIPQTAFSAWRRNDGLGVTTFFDLVTYTGNGVAGNRSIACNLGGNSPLFAIVTPHNGSSFFRDPSHTGLNSTQFSTGGAVTTAIVGGDLNTIVVNSSLNANGIVYDVFVIAGNPVPGGWGTNPTDSFGNFIPVTPVLPAVPPGNGPYQPPPTPPTPLPAGCISLVQAVTELGSRLGDFFGVHWTSTELQRYLLEALRVFNALTLTSRQRGTFTAVANTPYYDLPTVLQSAGGAFIRGYTLKDQDLILDLEYLLLEPANSTGWTGTAMFNQAALTQVLQRKRDMYLYLTAAVQTRETTAAQTPDANGRLALPSDVVGLRRVVWTPNGGSAIVAVRADEWGLNYFAGNWPVSSAPSTLAYSVGVEPPLTIQFAPPPNAQGTLDTIATVLGSTLNPSTGVLLGIPDDFAWVVKWGALSDLLAPSGTAADPVRASIARQLWDMGIEAAARASVCLAAQINSVPVRLDGLSDADYFSPQWLTLSGAPTTVLQAGQNLVALDPIPDNGGPYTVTLDVVRNMPIPTSLTDCYFNGGVALTEAMLDYAQFLALYKEGPSQAQTATALLNRFLAACGVAKSIDQGQVTNRAPLLNQTRDDEEQTPRRMPPVEP